MNTVFRTAAALLCALAAPALKAQGTGGDSSPQAAAAPAPSTFAPLSEARSGRRAMPGNLRRPVTLDRDSIPLQQALLEIASQVDAGLSYDDALAAEHRVVSVHVKRRPAADVLEQLLRGTGWMIYVSPAGQVAVVRRPARRADARGVINGSVVDSVTSRPLAGAVVTVPGDSADIAERDTTSRGMRADGLRLSAVTDDSGRYYLVTRPGLRTVTVRMLGYSPQSRVVVVVDQQATHANFALRMGMSRLQEVVTTATGPRRRLELGNDIVMINADSIVATQPVPNVTALLEGRVPGLQVQHTSGAPGDPSRLRLRGAGSLTRSNDPIVIVDGVRVYAAQSDARSVNLASPFDPAGAAAGNPGSFGAPTPSPLDQIDVNTIEKIEVLKGPSAATLYGADAANGVIVITTKHGGAGPPRWSVSAERGMSYMPGRYPEGWFRWGHNTSDDAPRWCPTTDLGCVADSVVRFQPLNDPELTPLGHGSRTALTFGVNGGSDALQYALTGSASEDVGLLHLPGFAARQFQTAQGITPPSWMQRPHDYKTFSGTSRMTMRLGRAADVALTTMFSRDEQQRTSLENQLGELMYTYVDPATGSYETAQSGGYWPADRLLSDFYQRSTDVATTFRNVLNVGWRPLTWLSGSADAGFDLVSRDDEVLLPRGYSPAQDSVGMFNRGSGSSFVTTVNVRGTAIAPLPWSVKLQTAVGANYTSTRTNDAMFFGTDIPVAAVSPDQAAFRSSGESRSELTTFGWYVEPTLSRKRIWLSTGLRLDGGNTFGSHAKLAGFPKVSASYLVSDEPFFPFKRLFNTLRLRAAYGHAGVQPGAGDRLRLYGSPFPAPLDSQAVSIIQLQTLGNTNLKPERSTELEGGFDADLLDDRVSLSVTGYRKTREDALMQFPLPPSVFGEGATITRNIGVIRNSGAEASLSAQLVRSASVTWSAEVSVSRNRNMVVSLAPGVAGLNAGTPGTIGSLFRLQVGYPLFGIWARPILGYSDVNHDKVLEQDEVLVGDSLAYMGAPTPDYQASFGTGVSLFRGAVRVDAAFQYEHGMTQIDAVEVGRTSASRALNDPTVPWSELAGVLALSYDLAGGLMGPGATPYGVIQNVSLLRFNSLSVAYNAPPAVARRLGASALTLALQGMNLGLFSSYRGKDPNVNAYPNGNTVLDAGQLPAPRTWQLRVSLQY
ncbi:MAG TPA: TonB-dependent receptor [Gemmatimonadaceae bacterium]|nr:TonB-dependent receptor [Gemmatimonadaceae bacterium]